VYFFICETKDLTWEQIDEIHDKVLHARKLPRFSLTRHYADGLDATELSEAADGNTEVDTKEKT